MAGRAGFINVDLEVGARSRARLAPVMEALEGKLVELLCGRVGSLYRAHYELLPARADASATIRALAAVVEELPAPARRAWSSAAMRGATTSI